ncbi:DUF7948 domain-containing protein [Paenibacillus lycopersici]|uniref:DUF7948 domain-containing protein n=1 Tax=Paenibacillus lycopersici TaxID=2704462 RepID=UPI001CDC29A5|nr:SBBP repeat-containing protein [Paenibacillus lycopersici]
MRKDSRRSNHQYGRLPLLFARNIGQFRPETEYLAHAAGFRCSLEKDRIRLAFFRSERMPDKNRISEGIVLDMLFEGRGDPCRIEGTSLAEGRFNYFQGSDPSRHYASVDVYCVAAYREPWPGIDVEIRGEEGQLKFDWIVSPGARTEDIRLRYEGADEIEIDEEGRLLIMTEQGILIDGHPVAYQVTEDERKEIDCRYTLESGKNGEHWIGFELGAYEKALPLVIDPVIEYSTFLGGTGVDEGIAIAVDAAGQAYVTGSTLSANFPVTPGAFQSTLNGTAEDMFVTKLNATGTALLYSTYLGGSARDIGRSIAVDSTGSAYVTGTCFSLDYPTTPGSFMPAPASTRAHAVVTKLDPSGSSLVYSTYLGGTGGDGGSAIALDAFGNAYVAGQTDSKDFPTTSGAFAPVSPSSASIGFVTKLNATGSGLIYSTFLGGNGTTDIRGIAVDGSFQAYVTGGTVAKNFPTTPGAFQIAIKGGIDGYVTKFNAAGTSLIYSTYLGGTLNDTPNAIAVDDAGNAYVTGPTNSADYPTTPGAFVISVVDKNTMIFVTKLNPTGSQLIYSSLIGGNGANRPTSIALASSFNAVITGETNATDYPVTPDAFQSSFNGQSDAFVTILNPFGSAPQYSTYLGGSSVDFGNGIAVDPADAIFVTGQTFSNNYPTTPGVFQPARRSIDAFVTKFGNAVALQVSKFSNQFEVRPGDSVVFFIDITNDIVALTNVTVDDPLLGFTTRIPELGPFETKIFEITFVVPPSQKPGLLVNETFVRADQIPQPIIAEASILVVEQPRIVASKTVNPSAATPGESVVFTIALINQGNVDLVNVRIVDPLLGLDQVLDVFKVGTSYALDWPFVIPEGQQIGLTIANVVTITADNLPAPVTVGTAVEVLPAPRLELLKTGDRNVVAPGEIVIFTIVAANTGNDTLTNLVVSDDVVGLNTTMPSLAPGESETFQISFVVPLETPPGSYTNTSTAVSVQTDVVFASFSVSVIAVPRLGIRKVPSVKSATVGETFIYSVVAANFGNVPLTEVRFSDPLLGFDRIVPRLEVGETLQIDIPFTVPAGSEIGSIIVNVLSVDAAELATQQVESTVNVTSAGLAISKSPDRGFAAPGETVNYMLEVINLLAVPQTNVMLADLQLGLSETVASIPAGGSITRIVSFVIPAGAADGSVISNEFVVLSDLTPVQRTSAEVVVVFIPAPGSTTLAVRKLPDRDVAQPGETVNYTVEIANTGTIPATGVVIQDSLTGGSETIPVIAPGGVAFAFFTFTIPADTVQGVVIANRATVTWNELPPDVTSEFGEARVTAARPRSLLDVSATADPSVAVPGATVTKTISVRNLADTALTDVRVIDPLLRFSAVISMLGPGEVREFVLPYTVPADAAGATIFNNHFAVFSDQTPLQQETVLIETAVLPNALLTQTVDRTEGHPGETVFFSIRAKNTGNVDLLQGVLTAPLLNLRLGTAVFDVNADVTIRIPFVLPDVEDGTVLTSRAFASSSNGPTLEATAFVRVVVDEE